MEQKQPGTPENPAEQPSIFTPEDLGPGQYDKTIRRARTALFVLAGIQGVMSFFLLAGDDPQEAKIISLIMGLVVAGVFLGLGFYSRKKPYTAILTGLIVYLCLIALDAAFDVTSLFKGIILKIVVIVYFIQALRDARDAQEAMKL